MDMMCGPAGQEGSEADIQGMTLQVCCELGALRCQQIFSPS